MAWHILTMPIDVLPENQSCVFPVARTTRVKWHTCGTLGGSPKKGNTVVKPTPKCETHQFGVKISWIVLYAAGRQGWRKQTQPEITMLTLQHCARSCLPQNQDLHVEYFLTRKNSPGTKSTTFRVLNKMSCAVSPHSMAQPRHHMNIRLQRAGGKHSWYIGEEQFPAMRVQCSISNCVVFIGTPT